jgi:predicted RecA/RadA family phage recombinase
MAYTGQPVPSTVYNAVRAKISDGKSVRVEVPENTTVEAGKFYLLGGFFGAAMQSVTTGAGETAEVILNIEPAEFETDQTKEADRASMTVGKDIYWDNTEKHFTVTGTTVYVGKVTSKADTNGVIWFKLAECPYALDDVTTLAAAVGDLTDLETTDKTSIVEAINEVVDSIGDLKAENVSKIDDVEELSVSDATDLQAVATALNGLIDALVNAGLMKAAGGGE